LTVFVSASRLAFSPFLMLLVLSFSPSFHVFSTIQKPRLLPGFFPSRQFFSAQSPCPSSPSVLSNYPSYLTVLRKACFIPLQPVPLKNTGFRSVCRLPPPPRAFIVPLLNFLSFQASSLFFQRLLVLGHLWSLACP